MRNSPFEIALLFDTNIYSDMLAQIESLTRLLSDSSEFQPRLVIFGQLHPDSAVARRYEHLCSCLGKTGKARMFHVPSRHSLGPLDALSLARSKALAGCDLLHCFSLSLLDTLLSLPVGGFLPPCCLSLSSWPGRRVVRRLTGRKHPSFARLSCFTDDLRDDLIAAGIPADRCSVIPAHLSVQQPLPEKSAARRLLHLPQDADLVLADSQISACSNQQQLSWALAIVGQFLPRMRVIFPGCDPHLSRLRRLDQTLTPPSLGIYPAEKFDPDLLYAAADVLALPATGPVSPLPIFRAARARLPVVASDSPSFRRYLNHEHNALLFSPNSYTPGDRTSQRIRPLAGAIARLLEDRDLAKQLASRLARDIDSSFPPGRSLPAHLQLYQNILGLRRD